MSLGTILVIVLILVLLGDIPAWQHSRAWGWSVGLVGFVLIIVPSWRCSAESKGGTGDIMGLRRVLLRTFDQAVPGRHGHRDRRIPTGGSHRAARSTRSSGCRRRRR